jgi:hypothetical protein
VLRVNDYETETFLFCFDLGRVYWDTQPTYCGLRGCDTVRWVDSVWNVMAHAQKPDFVFRRNGQVHLNRRGRQFSRLLAGELCTSACRVCTARDGLCSAVMWHLLATHCILLFPLHFSRASPCAIIFQLDSIHNLLGAGPLPCGCAHSAQHNDNHVPDYTVSCQDTIMYGTCTET